MDIKKAKEILECNEEQESLEKLGYIDKREFLRDWDVAFEIAIKSLDMWDKVIKEIEDDEQMAFMYGSIDMYTGIKESREVIEKYKKEVENG